MPALRSGVFVHFHDILYPFEYPSRWIYEGRAWNEAYLLRAFLQYNSRFRIAYFGSFFYQFHGEAMRQAMPLATQSPGSSLWLTIDERGRPQPTT